MGNGVQQTYSYFNGLNLNLWFHYSNWTFPPPLTNMDGGWTDLPQYGGADLLSSTYDDMSKVILPLYEKIPIA